MDCSYSLEPILCDALGQKFRTDSPNRIYRCCLQLCMLISVHLLVVKIKAFGCYLHLTTLHFLVSRGTGDVARASQINPGKATGRKVLERR